MATTTREKKIDRQQLNGWDLDEFGATLETLKETPEAGQLTWRNHVLWDSAFGGDVHVDEIEQSGALTRRKFTLRSDHPPQLLGENTGPTAVELLLSGLGACIMGTYAAHATARGIPIERLELELEGTLDLNGFLQLQPMRAGLSAVRANVRVRSDATDEDLADLLEVTRRASPVYDSIANPVEIDATVQRLERRRAAHAGRCRTSL